jgi:hypothetical protein
MHKALFRFIALLGISCFTCANASSIATIISLESPVWVQKDNNKTELSNNSRLKVGDNIITGETGRVEMRLWSSTVLQLNADSNITILLEKDSDVATPYDWPRLYLDKGMACINYLSNDDASNGFKLNIGNTMFAVLSSQGDICVTREDGLSSIILITGSVRVTHSVDPNLIVLSEIGTEFRIDDKGSFELLLPSADDSPPQVKDPVNTKTAKIKSEPRTEIAPAKIEPVTAETNIGKDEFDDVVGDTPITTEDIPVRHESASAKEAAKVEPKQPMEEGIYDANYRVYLFSTRSKDVAEEVNQKFQKAGHSTQIYTNKSRSETYYRIAVAGFKTEKTAKKFAQSIVGTLGITGTWIGN